MENNINYRDDLYAAVNGEWEKQAVIPDDKPSTGGFRDLDDNVEKALMADFTAFASGSRAVPNDYVKQAITLYKKALDFKTRDTLGLKPILPRLETILRLKNLADFNERLVDLYKNLYNLPFHLFVDTNMKKTTDNALCLMGPATILPDTTYYQKGNESGAKLLALWRQTTAQVLAKFPLKPAEVATFIEDTITFDALITARVKSSEEWAEYNKNYNPESFASVAQKLAPVALEKFAVAIYEKVPTEVIVFDPRFLNEFSGLFNENTFKLYVHWAYVMEVLGATGYLTEELRVLGGAFSRALTGSKAAPNQEKHAYRLANSQFDEPIGIYYGKTYFGEKAKADVTEMVQDLVETYKERLKANTWLSPQTREKAIVKLTNMPLHMGYPEQPKAVFARLKVDEQDDLLTVVTKLEQVKQTYRDEQLYKPVNRDEWVMPGHLVNACYNPTTNDITFPAAILQAPFYALEQSRSVNLGGIGSVIGHEISHAFDNNGAQCDEFGNLNNWWTEEDFATFKTKTQAMIAEFDGIAYADSKVNGKLIVSENIADNGGLAAAMATAKKSPDVDVKAFFINFARIWRMKSRKEYQQLLLAIDVHAPHELRANIQPRNLTEWYEAFQVKPTDRMYLTPEKRVHIW